AGGPGGLGALRGAGRKGDDARSAPPPGGMGGLPQQPLGAPQPANRILSSASRFIASTSRLLFLATDSRALASRRRAAATWSSLKLPAMLAHASSNARPIAFRASGP